MEIRRSSYHNNNFGQHCCENQRFTFIKNGGTNCIGVPFGIKCLDLV